MKNFRSYLKFVPLVLLAAVLLYVFTGSNVQQAIEPKEVTSLSPRTESNTTQPLPVVSENLEQAEVENLGTEDIWVHQQFSDDYPGMVKRRMIRALVPPSKTFFFLDKGKKRGLTYDGLMLFEQYINKQLKSRHLQVKVVVIPTSRKHLFRDLQAGYGDIAAGNLTITQGRQQFVNFSDPMLTGVDEIVVTGADTAVPKNILDLGGRAIYARKSSSYYDSLLSLNTALSSLGKKPVHIFAADEYLEDEDLLEMINAGLIPMVVIDSHKGKFWQKIFKNIRLQPQLKLRTGGKIAWAVRKNAPELLKVINGYIKKNKKGTLTGNILYRRYLENTKYVENNLSDAARERYNQTIALFEKYANQFDFPYLLLTALAYQESGLDHKKRSGAGAIGIMQVLPGTAKDKNVDIQQIELLDNNIHAGTKYLYFIKNRYFTDDAIDDLNRDLFTIAAYNAGPARIAKLRKEAAGKGLDPNVWFNNVEIIAANRIGRETVRYVANIYKYYVAYKYIVKQEKMKKVGKNILQQHYMGL